MRSRRKKALLISELQFPDRGAVFFGVVVGKTRILT